MHYIVNLTTEEYIECIDLDDQNKKLRQLFKKNTQFTAIIKEDINESRWNKNDKIVIAPENTNNFVVEHYSFIYI